MERLNLPPRLPEVETEEREILREVAQLLNYIYGAHTLNRQELATTVLGVTTKCLNTLSNEKLKVTLLEEQVDILYEELEHAKERREIEHQRNEFPPNDEEFNCFTSEKADEPPMDCSNSQINNTICSSTSEYVVQALLGNGTYGTVAQCWKKPSNETVALKIIKDSSSIEEAIEELKILVFLKALGSTQFNIVSCNEAFMFDGQLCLEFENLDINLLNYIRSQGFLRLQEIRPIIQQMAVALWFLEDAGVVHADLKPENIMLVDRYRQPFKLQVIDFGLARRNPEQWTGKTLQTLWYRAPEVLLGAPFNHTIDVWSLGCIAAEMLRGTPLFPANDENDMLQRIISIVGKPPDDLLELGLNTEDFFQEQSSGEQPQGWILKAQSENYPSGEIMSPANCSQDLQLRLEDLLKILVAVPTEDDQAVECDWKCFTDLVEKMLHPDDLERITPTAILAHPFIKLTHLNQQNHHDYVESSIKCMEICDNWIFDGVQNVEQPPYGTAGFDSNNLTSEHLSSGPTRDGRPSTQDVVSKGATQETHLECLDHSECVRKSREKNEDEMQCMASEGTSPSNINTNLSSPAKFSPPPMENNLSASNYCDRKRKLEDKKRNTPLITKKKKI